MKKIIVWLLAAFLLQFGIYEYLDRVVFAPSAAYTEHTVGDSGAAQSVSYSFDKFYYAVLSARALKIMTTKDNRLVRDISLTSNQSVTYFSWLPDRNLALAGISTYYANGTTVTAQSIDPDTNSKPVAPRITGLARGAGIEDISFSTKTNVTNILIKDGVNDVVYRTDANNYLRRLYLGTSHIDRIASLKDQNVLLYDDKVTRSVWAYYANGRMARMNFIGYSPCTLLGTDQNDNIYIGDIPSDNMVSAIYEGKIDGGFTEIKQLKSLSPAASIKVNYDGTISTNYVPFTGTTPFGDEHNLPPEPREKTSVSPSGGVESRESGPKPAPRVPAGG